jgi:two-component system chemotaxis response regulator CheB
MMIKVLVVEDSLTARELLIGMLESDPGIKVVGRAANGREALAWLERPGNKPDLITMDIHMPIMDGLETTRRIMETRPTPIVIVSAAWKPAQAALTFQAMEAGALSIIEKPVGPASPEYSSHARKLIQTVRLMSEVRVVKRRPRAPKNGTLKGSTLKGSSPGALSPRLSTLARTLPKTSRLQLVAIGASTGGPPVLLTILKGLPKDFPLPILIVQHITEGFLDGMLRWLEDSSGLTIHVASDGEEPRPGHVYLAPDGAHLGVNSSGRLRLDHGEAENGSRPSVSHLFRSIAQSNLCAIGVLLTGMGRDGALELKLLKDHGCLTIAQDKETSIIHGMPGEAIALGGASQILPPDEIADTLVFAARTMKCESTA